MSHIDQNTVLFNRLLEGKLSDTEVDAIVKWLGSDELDPNAAELILQQLKAAPLQQLSPDILSKLESRLPLILESGKKKPGMVVSLSGRKWLRYAASVLLLLGVAGIFLIGNRKKEKRGDTEIVKQIPAEITPGKEGAILTLEDGSTVVLDSLGNGLVATQKGTNVLLKNGKLVYDAAGNPMIAGYNTMATPKGRQFQLQLPDGSKVWLNAASSIRYPTVFTGNERKVEVTGEAYFEVAKDAARPFHVKLGNETEIQVLGTHFNVNSYSNEESINTTLLEGSVQVKNNSGKIILQPGQQARATGQAQIKIVPDVDIDQVMAWKNGVFDFQDKSLEEVMRQLERWYDIEVVYEKNIPKLEFIGKMGRDLNLSTVLTGLEKSNVHFRVEGRKLVVLP